MEGILNFGGLEEAQTGRAVRGKKGLKGFSVLPVPYDLTASYLSGARNGPRAIIEASTHMELYDEELGCEPYVAGIETLPFLEPTALGPEAMIKKVRARVQGMLGKAGVIPVILGGEHSITLGFVEALLKRHPKLSVLQLDAHADLRDQYQDSPYNHACVARRIAERCPVVQVGIRSLSVEEARFLRSKKSGNIKTHYAADTLKALSEDRVGALMRGLTDTVCITIDLDVFDPSIMPATGTPEPGGLLWYDVLKILKEAISGRTVAGFDVVELCPMPGSIAPDFLTAKLVYKIMGYINERALKETGGHAGRI